MRKKQPEKIRMKVPPATLKLAAKIGLKAMGFITADKFVKTKVEIYRTAHEDVGAWVIFSNNPIK